MQNKEYILHHIAQTFQSFLDVTYENEEFDTYKWNVNDHDVNIFVKLYEIHSRFYLKVDNLTHRVNSSNVVHVFKRLLSASTRHSASDGFPRFANLNIDGVTRHSLP
jgi:hypothetical protein